MKTLYEVVTYGVGESYVRFYVWTDNVSRASDLAHEKLKETGHSINTIIPLFNQDSEEFCTKVSDCGFESEKE